MNADRSKHIFITLGSFDGASNLAVVRIARPDDKHRFDARSFRIFNNFITISVKRFAVDVAM
jgi:hypothetical protein